jgi:serine/threonine protein kinase/Tfp pilus assembly protein PilF
MVGKTISHYKIIDKLGEGGMGVVYKAEDTKLDRTVAIKFLPKHVSSNDMERKRFKIEAKAAARLNHPNIATIHSIEDVDDELFIVMEYIDGKELKEDIESGPLAIDDALDISLQVAKGLRTAHESGVVHRDIKATNIMLTDKGDAKIMDFGLAKIRGGPKLTREQSTLGTAAYMSPEQCRGEEVDNRTDIFSLGVLLYEMLTGQLPFRGDYEQAIIYAILNENPDPITGMRTGIPMEIEKIVNKCLMKQVSDRYQHVDDLIVDLRLLKEQYGLKTSQSKLETSSKKRKPRSFISFLTVCILASIAILYFIFFKKPDGISSFPERKMLVVLPFKNLGPAEDEYFADGITEEITSRLCEIKQLGIIGRTSADQYKNTSKPIYQIGEELGVDYLLEGSVRWEKIPGKESRIRVIPQLIKVSDGTHIWTEQYDDILESVFDLQSDIAEKVAEALNITLLGTEQKSLSERPTDNVEAYDYCLRGNYYRTQTQRSEENYRMAENMFLKAVGLDSSFALAYIRLAQLNIEYYWFYYDRDKSRLASAKQYIDKAIEINPPIPEIYIVQGHYYYHGFLDYDNALFELKNGLKLYPDNSEILEYIGCIKRRQGNFEEAISYLKRSVELDPRSSVNSDIGQTYMLLKEYEAAEKYLDIGISIIPEWGELYYWKAKIHILRDGDVDGAYQILKGCFEVVDQEIWWVTFLLVQVRILKGEYEEALTLTFDELPSAFENQFWFETKSQMLARIYGLQNNSNLEKRYYASARAEIESKLSDLPDDERLHSALGIVLAGLGKKEEAIEKGIRATELLPITKEAWRGFFRELDLAKIYCMVGEYDLAIDKLEYLLSIPGELSVAYIKLDPVWSPLMEIPRFQKILEESI